MKNKFQKFAYVFINLISIKQHENKMEIHKLPLNILVEIVGLCAQ